MMEQALDPSNVLCQRYMIQVLVSMVKKMKGARTQYFKESSDTLKDVKPFSFCGVQITENMLNFNPHQWNQKNILDFLGQARELSLVSSLTMLLSSQDCNFQGDKTKEENARLFVENQYGHRVRKMGATKLAALELLYHFLLLLFPSFGDLGQMLAQGKRVPQPPHSDIGQDRYISKTQLRYLIKTLIYIMREHSYCNMALEMSALILAEVRSMFDIVDIVTLQKFVIQEFRERHLKLRKLLEEGTSEEVSRFKLDHMNMQSAQVNQIALSLKEKDPLITELYSDEHDFK